AHHSAHRVAPVAAGEQRRRRNRVRAHADRAAAATRRVIRNAARFSFQRRDPALVHGRGTRLRRVRAGRRTLSLRGRRSHCGCGQSLRRRLRRGASARTTRGERRALVLRDRRISAHCGRRADERDRKSTRLNSSHVEISYAVFCLKKKKKSHSDGSAWPFAPSLLTQNSFFPPFGRAASSFIYAPCCYPIALPLLSIGAYCHSLAVV